jgi:lipid-A-disaccharide synthase
MNICLIAGEASGDLAGSLLAHELRRRMPGVKLWGIGGRWMREAGVELLEDGSRWSAIGVVESLRVVPRLLASLLHIRHALDARKPDLLIPIDFGAFNLRVAGYAKTKGIKVLYFFPPGSWRRDGGINPRIPLVVDKVATPFPWSEDALRRAGVDARFVGHPLVDVVEPKCSTEEFREAFGLSDFKPIIGLLPGSRRQEVQHILKVQLQAAKQIKKQFPNA